MLAFALLRERLGLGWRPAFLLTAVSWGFLLTLLTELLSLARRLAFWPIVVGWCLVLVVLMLGLVSRPRPVLWAVLKPSLPPTSYFERGVLIALALVLLSTGLVAWVAPPNTWDSMTYHMSRVMHWSQNQTLAFYPTGIPRQLHQNPWSEFAILHFQVLTGTDRLANFVQWFSMLGSILGVTHLAQMLGASWRGQLLAAVFCATLPMGVMQGSSTQTDYVVSFWLVCLVGFSLDREKPGPLKLYLHNGAALGLATLTKATAYVYAFPFVLWFAFSQFRRRALPPASYRLASMLLVALVLNAGHSYRNFSLYGQPLGPGQEGIGYSYANDVAGTAVTVSGLVRNTALHLASPIASVNRSLESFVVALHQTIGLSPSDAGTTWGGERFQIPAFYVEEDVVGNPLHFLMIVITLASYLLGRLRDTTTTVYLVSTIAGFVLFCAYLKWQPWHSRLHLPLFVLAAPFVGVASARLPFTRVVNSAAAILIAATVPYILLSTSKPLLGAKSIFRTDRSSQYFIKRPELLQPYFGAATIVGGQPCKDVGLLAGANDWEYPLFPLLAVSSGSRDIRLFHLSKSTDTPADRGVENRVAGSACAVIAVGQEQSDQLSLEGRTYSRRWASQAVSVYLPQ